MTEAWDLQTDMFLSTVEVDALLTHLETRAERTKGRTQQSARLDEMIVVALLLSGLRSSEFCELAVGNTIVGTGVSAFVVHRRAGPGRMVCVPQRVSDLVRGYVDEVRPRFLPAEVDPDDQKQPLVFNEHRRPYERSGLYRRVVRILTEAGLGDRASVQLLRHTYGYLAYLRTGGNLLFVQRQLGHAHPRITSVYAELVEESYADLAERVAGESAVWTAERRERVYKQCRPAFDCAVD